MPKTGATASRMKKFLDQVIDLEPIREYVNDSGVLHLIRERLGLTTYAQIFQI